MFNNPQAPHAYPFGGERGYASANSLRNLLRGMS